MMIDTTACEQSWDKLEIHKEFLREENDEQRRKINTDVTIFFLFRLFHNRSKSKCCVHKGENV